MNRRDSLQMLAAASFEAFIEPVAAADGQLRIGLTPVILADQVAFLSRWGRYLSARTGCEVSFKARES
jgi:phosphonate transport system substrate-binding protein